MGIRPHPTGTPQIGERLPLLAFAQTLEAAFLFSNNIRRIVAGLGEPSAFTDGARQRRLELGVGEQRGLCSTRAPPRLPAVVRSAKVGSSRRLSRDVDGR